MNYNKVIFDYPRTNKAGIQMLAYKPYSSNPGDSFLFVVLCYWPRDFENEWIVWKFNAQTKSTFQGRYFFDKDRAYADFLTQGRIKFDIDYFNNKDAIELSAVEFNCDEVTHDRTCLSITPFNARAMPRHTSIFTIFQSKLDRETSIRHLFPSRTILDYPGIHCSSV